MKELITKIIRKRKLKMKKQVTLDSVSKASIKRELDFKVKELNKLDEGLFSVVGPKGIDIELRETEEENVYDVVDISGSDQLDLDVEDIDLDLELDIEDDVPAKLKKKAKKAKKEAAEAEEENAAPLPKKAKKAKKAEEVSFTDEVIAKVANGSILTAKKIAMPVKDNTIVGTVIGLLESSKIQAEVEYKSGTITFVGEQAGLAATYIVLTVEDK